MSMLSDYWNKFFPDYKHAPKQLKGDIPEGVHPKEKCWDCPVKVRLGKRAGVFSIEPSNLIKCCRYKAQKKAMKSLIDKELSREIR